MRQKPALRVRVGRNVKHWRQLRNMTQETLAELVGNSSKHIGQVERGEVNVTIDILTAIASALSIHPGDLFDPAPTRRPRLYAISQRDLDQMLQILKRARSGR